VNGPTARAGGEGGPADGAGKAALRRRLLAARRALGTAERSAADARIRAALTPLLAAAPPTPVAGYAPMPGEPGGPELVPALAAALAPGGLLLPVLAADDDLDWAAHDGALRPARLGLSEPDGPRLGPAAVARAGLVIVPAVAVDRRGVRLGRGGGSYDRALARVRPGVPVVALLYDGELLPAVPAEPHDRRVGAVVTPTGLVRLPVR
jgi:5-formyltetrahydrofolate cyclo-ligase